MFKMSFGESSSVEYSIMQPKEGSNIKQFPLFEVLRGTINDTISHKIGYIKSFILGLKDKTEEVEYLKKRVIGVLDHEDLSGMQLDQIVTLVATYEWLPAKHYNNLTKNMRFLLHIEDLIYEKDIEYVYEAEFIATMNGLLADRKLPNYTIKKDNNVKEGSQRLNRHFLEEMYFVYKDFGSEEGEEVIKSLNRRGKLKSIELGYDLYLNYNSHAFYRDTNFSLSLIKEGKEVAIIGFVPVGSKTLEIGQIQGKSGIHVTEGMFKVLIEEMKEYARKLGFEKLQILRGEKNYLYHFPKNKGLNYTLQQLKEHQDSLRLRYSVTPHRKWGFTKPDEWYSYFDLTK